VCHLPIDEGGFTAPYWFGKPEFPGWGWLKGWNQQFAGFNNCLIDLIHLSKRDAFSVGKVSRTEIGVNRNKRGGFAARLKN
jgi:hypothetical protein